MATAFCSNHETASVRGKPETIQTLSGYGISECRYHRVLTVDVGLEVLGKSECDLDGTVRVVALTHVKHAGQADIGDGAKLH
jgi:hypothetical protein